MSYEFNLTDRLAQQDNGIAVQRDVLFGVDWRNNRPRPIETDALVHFVGKNGTAFAMTDAMLSRMTLLVGGNGYGKTNVMNFAVRDIRRALRAEDTLIIFDSKGDNYNNFYCAAKTSDIVVGGSSQYKSVTKYWNIFDELRNDTGEFDAQSEEQAKELVKQLAEEYRKTTQPFFPMAAADIIANTLIFHIRGAKSTGDERYLNNWSLVNFLRGAERKTYEQMVSVSGNEDMSAICSYLGKSTEKVSGQALGIFAYIHKMMDDLFVGIFAKRAETPEQEFSMRRFVQDGGGKTLFLEYDLERGELLSPIYRILIDIALKKAMRRNQMKKRLYLVADELRLCPALAHLQDGVNFGRGLGVRVLAGIQSINQLADAYGELTGKVIAGGFTNCICFNTPDYETRKFISERLGAAYYNYWYTIKGNPVNVQREGYVVEDWDILDMDVGETFVSLAGGQLFRFFFEQYEKVYP